MKHKLTLLIIVLAYITSLNGQTVKPQFRGGEEALKEYIDENLQDVDKYDDKDFFSVVEPDDCTVDVRFLVSKTGIISGVKVIDGYFPGYIKEAERLVKSMPKWIAGTRKGVKVAMYDTLTIDFKRFEKSIAMVTVIREEDKITTLEKEKKDNDFFVVVDEMPSFPGGQDALFSYIRRALIYPVEAAENGIEGRVTTQFIVEKDGSVSDVKVIRGVDPSCDKEAIRVIKGMPKWTPGKQQGVTVRVAYVLPIIFIL
jgi:TonB family protein